MEHVWNYDEFMKDKCGGGIKENIMCMKVWKKLLEKMGVVNCVWCVKEGKKIVATFGSRNEIRVELELRRNKIEKD